MTMTNFPNGFPNGVTLRNMPILNLQGNEVFWVDNSTPSGHAVGGSDSNSGGTYNRPFATIDYAIGRCTAGKNSKIIVKAGHAETINAASFITCDVAGIEIIGLGTGNERPTLTWATSTAATIVISAAGTTIRNFICVCNIDQLVTGFSVTAANCTLDIEWQDSATNKEAIACITGGTGADKLTIRLRYMGQTGGSHCATPIKLNGTDEGLIDVDFYGLASTAVVNFVTTACTGIRVTGNMYNSGTTDGSKNVVDTITGSKWWAEVFDGAAGGIYRSGSALGVGTYTGPAGTGPGGSRVVSKVIANAAASLTTGLSPVTLFTVTGDVMVRVFATVQTSITSTLNNGTLAIGVTGATGGLIAATTANGTNFVANHQWIDTSTDFTETLTTTSAGQGAIIATGLDIICTIATNSMTAGAITFYCLWWPLSSGSSVVAA